MCNSVPNSVNASVPNFFLSRLLSGVCEGPFGGLTGISFFFGEIRHVLGHFLVAFWTLLLGGVPCVGCHSRLAGSV